MHTEIEKILNDVIKFKIHVQTGLEGYEQFVDEEVSGEYESLDREDAEVEALERERAGYANEMDEGEMGYGAEMDLDE